MKAGTPPRATTPGTSGADTTCENHEPPELSLLLGVWLRPLRCGLKELSNDRRGANEWWAAAGGTRRSERITGALLLGSAIDDSVEVLGV